MLPVFHFYIRITTGVLFVQVISKCSSLEIIFNYIFSPDPSDLYCARG